MEKACASFLFVELFIDQVSRGHWQAPESKPQDRVYSW